MSERLANPFQFLDVERRDPNKRSMQSRTEEFVEIYDPFTCLLYTSPSPRD